MSTARLPNPTMLSRPEADLVRRDGALPGLAMALDAEALLAALGPTLAPTDIRAVALRYLRYKPRTNCLVAYRFDVGAPEPQAVDVHAKVHRPDSPEKLAKSRERTQVPGCLGPGRIVLEDSALVVWVFPNDLRLRALRRLADQKTRLDLLRHMLPERPDVWGGTLRTLRYKPERRYVAQLETVSGARVVLKAHAAPRYERAATSAAAFRSHGTLRVPRLLGRSPSARIVALEWLPGQPLNATLADGTAALDAVTAVGAAIGELHRQRGAGVPAPLRGTEAAGLLALAADLGFLCPDLAGQAQELGGRLAARLEENGPELRPIHGDFSAEQVLLDADRVAIFDLDRATLGDPAADLGTFVAHLEREVLRGALSAARVAALRAALLEGYRAGPRHPSLPRVDLYTAVGLFRLAPEPFRAREPDWPGRIAAILTRAAAAAADAA